METPWDYFENRKYKKWNELNIEEQSRLVLAVSIIQSDLGVIPNSDIEIKQFLSNNMPLDTLPIKLK